MKIAIIGTGYVGLPSGVGLAEIGHQVTCIDYDETKIQSLKNGISTLYEEGLEDLLKKNIKLERIQFTSSIEKGIQDADVVFIAVGTPQHPKTNEADMQYVYAAVKELAKHLSKYTVIAIKSTVPIGTGDIVEKLIKETNPSAEFDVVSLPEFLREGFAVYDFFNPDRIVIGTSSQTAKEKIESIYKLFPNPVTILNVSRRSSEMIKYASNAFLAVKLHYINEIANLCENIDANVKEVAKGMGLDTRIGNKFLNAGPGYGGSCFPKDTAAILHIAQQSKTDMTIINAAYVGNKNRKKEIANRILDKTKNIQNPKIAIFGLAFKNNTDDCRESPAIEIIQHMLDMEFSNITAYDPQAINSARNILSDKIQYASNPYNAAKNADILVILTEWEEFKTIDYKQINSIMKGNVIIDCRNILDYDSTLNLGFSYQGIGFSN